MGVKKAECGCTIALREKSGEVGGRTSVYILKSSSLWLYRSEGL
jgi:hypothetical protein